MRDSQQGAPPTPHPDAVEDSATLHTRLLDGQCDAQFQPASAFSNHTSYVFQSRHQVTLAMLNVAVQPKLAIASPV